MRNLNFLNKASIGKIRIPNSEIRLPKMQILLPSYGQFRLPVPELKSQFRRPLDDDDDGKHY